MIADAAASPADTSDSQATPLLRVLYGEPTAEELGALVTVLASAVAAAGATRGTADASAGPSPWASPALMHRHPIAEVGPGAWQRSLR